MKQVQLEAWTLVRLKARPRQNKIWRGCLEVYPPKPLAQVGAARASTKYEKNNKTMDDA